MCCVGEAPHRAVPLQMADVSDPQLREVIADVRSDATATDWCMLTYADKTTICVHGSGDGGYNGMMDAIVEDKPLFILLRLGDGDAESQAAGRCKFVFITYVGDDVRGLAKSRVGSHMSNIKPLFGVRCAACLSFFLSLSPPSLGRASAHQNPCDAGLFPRHLCALCR